MKCGENEYLRCGDVYCAEYCGVSLDPMCNEPRFHCEYGCFCKPGYISAMSERCITVKECETYYIRPDRYEWGFL